MSAPTEHALLSASGASRWLACPPSARLEEPLPEQTSDYAEAGRLAHAIAELKMRKHFVEPMGPRKFATTLKTLQADPVYQPEMLTCADTYLEYVQAIYHGYAGAKPYVITERRVDYSTYVPEGFGTCDCLLLCGADLHVIDYKYGQGVSVSAERNPQMQLYALGAREQYKTLFAITNVVLHIVQPRLNNASRYALSAQDLLTWAENIRPIAQLAYEGKGEFCAGEHCRFCRAKAVCRARASQQLALESFAQTPPALLSLQEIGGILTRAQTLAKWAKDIEDYALAQSLAGQDVPGWKAVEGRSVRAWTDLDTAFAALLKSGVDEALLYERKPVSLAGVEKLIGKKAFDEVAAEYVAVPPGKPTLVPASDKRQAITNQPTLTQIFAN